MSKFEEVKKKVQDIIEEYGCNPSDYSLPATAEEICRLFDKAEPLIRQDEREKTMLYVVARLREVDGLSLDKPDFVRRIWNLIVELEQQFKKGER